MWCYQKPGFETLLLAQLQKQQQSSQFCDTVLKADGVSVPAHSCVLSAISSQFSTALSQTPALGQKRLLEFGPLGASTLLHMVRLLYSGEMVGEGERERQEAVSAASKLGIHGLVEISHIDGENRKMRDERLFTEVGVQTDSRILEENQVKLGGWKREVRDGATFLWRERLPTRGTEIWTQTEDLQISGSSCSQLPVTYETIDLNALQTLSRTDPLQLPYVPMSVAYPNEDSHGYGPSSVSAATPTLPVHYSSVHNNVFSVPNQATPHAAETSHWGQDMGRTSEVEEWPEEEFEQFEGNIPGFINYFLKPDHEEDSSKRRGRRRQGAGVGGVRQSGMRGRPRGRGRLTQTVDVQDVGVSKLSKMYLERWGVYLNRTGQGGGVVGRKLYMKSREFVRSGRSTRRRKGRGIEWDLDQSATILKSEKRKSSRPRKAVITPVQAPVSPPQRVQRDTKQPTVRSSEEQPEQIDQLLEEVMMGLEILPNNNTKSQTFSSTRRHGTPGTMKTERGQCGSTAVVTVGFGGKDPPTSEVPVLQQQNEGELTDILDQFLQSFERLESAAAQSSSESTELHINVNRYRKHNQLSVLKPQHPALSTQTPTRPSTSTQSETSGTDSPMGTAQTSAQQRKNLGKSSPAKKRPVRRKTCYLLSLEKPRTKSKKSEALNREEVKQRVTRQLQQRPVVKLERRKTLPDNIKVQELSQSPGPRAKKCTSPMWGTKTYPIRSRFKEAQIMDAMPFLEEPVSNCRIKATKHGFLTLSSPPGVSLSTVEEQMESNEDEAGSDTRESEHRGRKRASDSDEEMSNAAEVKRICFDSDAEVIDVETISQSDRVQINNTREERSTDAESSDIIDVDNLDRDFSETELKRETLVHTEVNCSLRADITAGEPEDLESDIDVIGGSSPAPSPVLISWTDSSEAEEDTDTDALDQQTVLSKGRLVHC